MPLDVPADYGREELHTLVSFFVILLLQVQRQFSSSLDVKLNLADTTRIPENVRSACTLSAGRQLYVSCTAVALLRLPLVCCSTLSEEEKRQCKARANQDGI